MKTFLSVVQRSIRQGHFRTENLSGDWFVERGLPMIVECTCCEATMVLSTAFIDDNDYLYCSTCADES